MLRVSFGVNRKMCRWEAGEQWPGRAHPSRLWVDIWSQSQWNVRRVMTGMVIGRLWLDLWPGSSERSQLTQLSVSFKVRLFSSKLTVHFPLHPLVTVVRPVKFTVLTMKTGAVFPLEITSNGCLITDKSIWKQLLTSSSKLSIVLAEMTPITSGFSQL